MAYIPESGSVISQGAFHEVLSPEANALALKCPTCHTVVLKRRDSFLVGAHHLTCRKCGYGSREIILLGGDDA